VKHGGPARDTTIQAATKAAARQKTQFTKTFCQMDDIMSEFAAEMAMIESMKKELVVNQKCLATTSLRWYSALIIQQCYRRVCSIFLLKKLKKGRLISNWVYFRSYHRKRCKAAKKISDWMRQVTNLHRLLLVLRYNHAARKLQRLFRNRKKKDLLAHALKVLQVVKSTRDHCLLFGMRRALHHFMAIKERETTGQLFSGEYTYAEINRVRRCIAKWIRRRRLKL
jgi:hypothetical protein